MGLSRRYARFRTASALGHCRVSPSFWLSQHQGAAIAWGPRPVVPQTGLC